MNNDSADDFIFDDGKQLNNNKLDLADETDFELRYPAIYVSSLSKEINETFDEILEKCKEIYPKSTCLCKFCKKLKSTSVVVSSSSSSKLNDDLNNLTEVCISM